MKTARDRRVMASILGAIGISLWATETVLINLTQRIPPIETVALAFVFAAATTPIACLLTRTNPLVAFRQPAAVWAIVVSALVGYHACIYYATQKAPPAAAALLQGTTPLMIVLGSALLPGEKLRWWHVVGATLGLFGVLNLIEADVDPQYGADSIFYLSLIGVAAALWGLYSIASRYFAETPSSVFGVFYAAAALVSLLGHGMFETWVQPDLTEWAAIAALGVLPMGLAIYLWDYGCKHGDIQALGAFSYVEPFIGACLVVLAGQGALGWTLVWSGLLVVGGAVIASASLFRDRPDLTPSVAALPLQPEGFSTLSSDMTGAELAQAMRRRLVMSPDAVAPTPAADDGAAPSQPPSADHERPLSCSSHASS